MEYISSVANQKIKDILKLKEQKYRKNEQKFLLEGFHLIQTALEQGIVLTLLGSEANLSQFKQNWAKIAEIIIISDNVADKLSDVKTSQAIFAVCQLNSGMIDLTHNVLLLDQIQDPGNLGTLIRSGAAFNFKTIIASHNSVSFYNDKVLRSTQGNFFQVNLLNDNLVTTIATLKANGYLIFGTSLHTDAKMLDQVTWNQKQKYALVIGNEGQGISPEIAKLVDFNILIEMTEGVESLNAGVAGSIIMYQINNH